MNDWNDCIPNSEDSEVSYMLRQIGFYSDIAKEAEKHYKDNKEKRVGEFITCACYDCTNKFIKKTKVQAFCSTKCKDKFWNYRTYTLGKRSINK